MNDRAQPQALDYHRPVPLIDRVVAHLRVEHLAIAIAFCGFSISLLFGGARYRPDTVRVVSGLVGALILLVGTLWYVVLRVLSRKSMPVWLRAQLVLATIVCLVGVFLAVSFADQAREGPRGVQYWLTYNQTYARNPLRAAKSGWMTAVGVGWFLAVLAVDRLCRNRCPPCPPSSQSE